jgi:hypothetical protein
MSSVDSCPEAARLPSADEVRRNRVRDQGDAVVWDREAWVVNGEAAQHIAAIHALFDGNRVQRTSYLPYESPAAPHHQAGGDIVRAALRTGTSPELAASVQGSSVGASILAAAASVRARLEAGAANGVMKRLDALGAVRGGEITRLIHLYRARQGTTPEDAIPMAIRDFYGAWFRWAFPRSTDGFHLDLCGSVMDGMLAYDYVGAADSPTTSGVECFIAAASEGFAAFGGTVATEVFRDIATVIATMKTKDCLVRAASTIEDPAAFGAAAGGAPTPNELWRARWWEAGMASSFRLPMSLPSYRHLTDELGSFLSLNTCGRIKRAIDDSIRYNEIVDMVFDYQNKEWLNDALNALAAGGTRALLGYGNACGQVIEDVLACDCGRAGHEEAAEIAMGDTMFYIIPSRYHPQRQLDLYHQQGGAIRQAFAWPAAGTRLRSAASTRLQPGFELHSAEWEPLWTAQDTSGDSSQSLAADLARRIGRRSVPGMAEPAVHVVATAAMPVLLHCDRLEDPADLRALAAQWCDVFDTAATASPISMTTQYRHAADRLRPIVGRVWADAIIGHDDAAWTPQLRAERQLSLDTLYLDFDHAIVQSYALPAEQGAILRRAFFGTTSSAAELSGFSPYNRLTDGIASLTRTAPTPANV